MYGRERVTACCDDYIPSLSPLRFTQRPVPQAEKERDHASTNVFQERDCTPWSRWPASTQPQWSCQRARVWVCSEFFCCAWKARHPRSPSFPMYNASMRVNLTSDCGSWTNQHREGAPSFFEENKIEKQDAENVRKCEDNALCCGGGGGS